MSITPQPNRERFDDVLIQQAIHGLNRVEQSEMEELCRHFQLTDDDRFESAVGALDSGFSGIDQQADGNACELSKGLRTRIIAEAAPYVTKFGESQVDFFMHDVLVNDFSKPAPSESVAKPTYKPSLTSIESRSGWSSREKWIGLAAAASLLLALASLGGLFSKPPIEQPIAKTFTLNEQLQQFESAGYGDFRKVSWTNPTNDPASKNASGEVVWSDQAQQGFMVFDGLQVNNPTERQYQLWIFDTERDDALPVDGGVFDIDSDGRVIVPIDAKLSITQAKMFAITIEKPGGVVQSKRERLPLLASIEL